MPRELADGSFGMCQPRPTSARSSTAKPVRGIPDARRPFGASSGIPHALFRANARTNRVIHYSDVEAQSRLRLEAFLDAHPAHAEVRDDWPLEPVAPLLSRLCLASSLPPLEWSSSVLAIVARADGAVLFIHPEAPSGSIAHVLIGGRPEPGESPEQTVRREVAEETGWVVEPEKLIGFRHFRHLGQPHPELADRPYPDMVQPVYVAVPKRFDPTVLHPGEPPTRFVAARWAIDVTHLEQRPLLNAAIRLAARA